MRKRKKLRLQVVSKDAPNYEIMWQELVQMANVLLDEQKRPGDEYAAKITLGMMDFIERYHRGGKI